MQEFVPMYMCELRTNTRETALEAEWWRRGATLQRVWLVQLVTPLIT